MLKLMIRRQGNPFFIENAIRCRVGYIYEIIILGFFTNSAQYKNAHITNFVLAVPRPTKCSVLKVNLLALTDI